MSIKKELGKFTSDKSLLALVKTTFFTGFTKYIGVVLGFLLSVFLARYLGPENYGFFELVNKYFAIFSIFCLFGGSQVIVREVAKFNNQRQNKTFSSLTSGLLISGFLSLLCSSVFVIFSEAISNFLFGNGEMSLFIILIGISLPFQIISKLFSSALIGINKIWVGNLANQIIVVFIVVISVLVHYLVNKDISLIAIAVYYLSARVIMLMFYLIYWFKVVSRFTFRYDISKYLSYAKPLLLASATIVLMDSLASIFLGIYHDKSEIAFFSVGYKLSSFVAIILQISNSALSPKISNFYHNSRVEELNKILRRFTRILICIGFFVFIIFFISGEEILKVWGPDFIAANIILLILSFGQVFNLATGSSGVILIMVGYEKIRRNIAFVSVLFNLILLIVLVPEYAALGAAIAVSSTMIFDNLLKFYFVRKKTQITLI